MLENLFKLFDECEEIRRAENIKADPGYMFFGKSNNFYKVRHEQFMKKLENHEFGKTTDSGENLDAIQLYNLSPEEASIIYMYTHHSVYSVVNSQLRNAPAHLDNDVKEYSTLLDNALKKLPQYNNETVYRDVKFPIPNLKNSMNFFKTNLKQKVTFYDYMSSHKSKTRWSDEETGFQLQIKTSRESNARDLKYISFVQSEEEVIFISGTTFFVESMDEKNTTISLLEL